MSRKFGESTLIGKKPSMGPHSAGECGPLETPVEASFSVHYMKPLVPNCPSPAPGRGQGNFVCTQQEMAN